MRRQAPQRGRRPGSRRAALTLAAGLACAVPTAAAAQADPVPGPRALFGVEASAILGPEDTTGFFNYTDYEGNALRVARARLFGEWRLASWISLVGELRTEGADGLDASAAFARLRPWPRRALTVQVGRIPPVVGAFNRRAYGRDNALIGLTLAYQYLTSLRPDAIPATVGDLLRMRARGWRPAFPIGSTAVGPGVPRISVTQWSSGVDVHWQGPWLEAAGAWSMGAPGVPSKTDRSGENQWSGRLGLTLPAGLMIGVSGARGRWIDRGVLELVPEDRREASTQTLVATDAEYGWGPWLFRAEWLRSTFKMPFGEAAPGPQPLSAVSGFLETRVRLHPRWQVALRLDRLTFTNVQDTVSGVATPWEWAVDRVEAAVGFRAARRLDLRVGWQYNWRSGGRVRERGFPAVQALFWY